jgi:fatty-acyl-CoA synthase
VPIVSRTELTPLRFLGRSAEVYPDKVAIVHGDRRMTYRDFAGEATRLARALQASGIEPGDRVAYLCPNIPELLIAHFAVPLAGAVLVAMNTRLAGEEVRYICDHSGAKLLVVDSELRSTVAEVQDQFETVREIVTVTDPVSELDVAQAPDGPSYPDLLERGSDEPLEWTVEDELATIAINYTSGTTGKPKGVMYSHRGAYLNSLGELLHSEHRADSVYLWTLPMFHCNGWCTTWAVTAIGGRHVCLRAVRGDLIWQLLEQENVTHLSGAPMVLTTLASAQEAHALKEPLVVITAGAPPSPTTIAQCERLNTRIVHVYGLTETYGPYALCQWQEGWEDLEVEERAALLSRQGVGMIHAERLRVVDEAMNDVPADGVAMGEIVMRGNDVMKGYFLDEQATAEAFAGDPRRSWCSSPARRSARRRSSTTCTRSLPATRRPKLSPSWTSCQRPRRARCRSSSCASTSGPGKNPESRGEDKRRVDRPMRKAASSVAHRTRTSLACAIYSLLGACDFAAGRARSVTSRPRRTI